MLVALPTLAADTWHGWEVHVVPAPMGEQFLDIVLAMVPLTALSAYDSDSISEERALAFWGSPENIPFGLSSDPLGLPLWPSAGDLPALMTAPLPSAQRGAALGQEGLPRAGLEAVVPVPLTPTGLPSAGRGAPLLPPPGGPPLPGAGGGGPAVGRGRGAGRRAASPGPRPPSMVAQMAAMAEAFQTQTRLMEQLIERGFSSQNSSQLRAGPSPYQTQRWHVPGIDVQSLMSEAGTGPYQAPCRPSEPTHPPGLQLHQAPRPGSVPLTSQHLQPSWTSPPQMPQVAQTVPDWVAPAFGDSAQLPPGLRSSVANEGLPHSPPPLLHPQPIRAGASPPPAAAAASLQEEALTSVLQSQAALLQRLLNPASGSGVGQEAIGRILGGGGDASGEESGLKLPGARGAAAREAFRQEAIKRPLGIARTVYENMSQTMTADPAGVFSRVPTMRGYFQQETCFGSYKTLTYLGFAVATAFDWLIAGEQNLDRVKGLLALTCCAIDQVALDGGSWTLASQMLICLPEPPWNYVSRNQPGSNANPFTRLADPKWTAAIMGYLKDTEALKSQRRQPPPPRHEDPPRPSGPRTKGSGKGESKGDAAAAATSSG